MVSGKKGLILIGILTMVYLLSFAIAKTDTSAWFVSQTKADGKIVNATTADLLHIEPAVISYDANCSVQIQVDITNISEIEIPIQLENSGKFLPPGDVFSKIFTEKSSCEATEVTFDLTGLNHYIEETISVSLNGELLKETVKPETMPGDDSVEETNNAKESADDNSLENELEQVDGTETETGHEATIEEDGQSKE